jgi:Ser/Thr protein kinase RdoA (MazF antagonist)
MLPIDELVNFARTLDEDWHSPVADAVAEVWSLGRPRFLRSSASHVFVAPRRDGEGRVVLRIRPDAEPHREELERAARAAASWSAADAPVVNAVAAPSGHFTERVDGYVAHVLEAAEGDTLDQRDDLVAHAADWGEALARLHLTGHGVIDAPDAGDRLAAESRRADDGTATVAVLLERRLAALPRGPEVHGVLHGDPETDNVVLTDQGVRMIDLDRVTRGWFAGDVAVALRDWGTVAGGVDLDHEVPRHFVAGYRRVRDLSDEELGWLPLLAQASAVTELLAFQVHLDTVPQPDWPDWAVDLDHRVRARATALRDQLTV